MKSEETQVCILCGAEIGKFCEAADFCEGKVENCPRYDREPGKDPESYYVGATKHTIIELHTVVKSLA